MIVPSDEMIVPVIPVVGYDEEPRVLDPLGVSTRVQSDEAERLRRCSLSTVKTNP